MIERGAATEAEMVLAFVAAEIDSPTYQREYLEGLRWLGRTRAQLIDRPHFSPRDDQARGELLGGVRGFGVNQGLFTGFPVDVIWRRVDMEPGDFDVLRYARCEPWTELAPGSLKVTDGARNLPAIDTAADYRAKVHAIEARIRQGGRFPPLILAETPGRHLILIEGHTRATAYALQAPMHPIEAIVGASPNWHSWAFH